MIKKYNNGKVITDGNFESAVAVSSPRFSFPFENHRSVRLIEQDYVVRSDNYGQLILGSTHPIYTTAVLVRESGFQNIVGGLLRFTRSFLIVPNETFVFPKTSNVTFPSLKYDIEIQDDKTSREIPDIRDSFSKVVPCEERVTFVNLASNSQAIIENDSHIDSSTIGVGDTIYKHSNKQLYTITESSSGVSAP